MYLVLDLYCSQNNNLNLLIQALKDSSGVVSCTVGAFEGEGPGELADDASHVRICIINDNIRGMLAKVSLVLMNTLGLKIVSQVMRSRGESSYMVFDIEGLDNPEMVQKSILTIPNIRSCSFGNFKAGSLSAFQQVKDTYYEGGNKGRHASKASTANILAHRSAATVDSEKMVIVMVGLPARGKSFTARKLKRFFSWKNANAEIFNAGRYRRERMTSAEEQRTRSASSDVAELFSSANETGLQIRQDAANRALNDLLNFLKHQGGNVGIFDATNSTNERRKWISLHCKPVASVVFVEVICDDAQVLEENILDKVRNSPDYQGMDEAVAMKDMKDRIANYEMAYEPLDGDGYSYLKIFNMSNRVLANRVYGRLTRSILPYVLSIHIGTRPIWFVRAGLAEDHMDAWDEHVDPSTQSRDSGLCRAGVDFAAKLAAWIHTSYWIWSDDLDTKNTGHMFGRQVDDQQIVRTGDGRTRRDSHIKVLSSTLPRSVETAEMVMKRNSSVVESCPMLNPLDRGIHSGISNYAIEHKDVGFFERWSSDPYNVRYPGGESYYDLVTRLETVLIEIEQQTAPVLVVSHVSCIQVLLAYFMGHPVQESMNIKVPMHTVIQVSPNLGGSWDINEYPLVL